MQGPEGKRTPLVSVCIPTFNRSAKLTRAVEHVLASTYPHIEIVISDNASSDDTEQVCAQLCARHPNIRYFRHPVNRGPSPNFDFAREQARGEYFLWHGDDDHLGRDFISRCIDELEKDASLSLAAGLGAYHYGDGVTVFHGNRVESRSNIGLWRAAHLLFYVYDASMFNGVYRVASVRDCVMPNFLAGDWAWLAHVLIKGKARILPDTFVYRQVGDNTSGSYERIVATLGLPAWHARRPWLAIPLNLANHLAFRSGQYRWPTAQVPVWLLVFGVSFAKQAILMLAPKLPFGQRLSRWIFRHG